MLQELQIHFVGLGLWVFQRHWIARVKILFRKAVLNSEIFMVYITDKF